MTIYLDHAAATPVDRAVAAAMCEALTDPQLQANPAATHAAGEAARGRVEQARAEVAALIGAAAGEIVWTSGATESNNLALIGAARLRAGRGRHLVTAASEHASVLAACDELERQGFAVTRLPTDPMGIVEPAVVAAALRPDTTLVSLMQVNNETGVVQDIAAIGTLCRERGVLLHVDAAQAAGREAIDVRALQVDLLSLSAHKMYGPKGIGALFISRETVRRVEPVLVGGGQERGLRPGTVATHQVIGMGVAARLAAGRRVEDCARLVPLREALWAGVSRLPGVFLNGHPQRRACHILNVSVAGIEGESLLHALRELAVSSGAACAAESAEPSAVLRLLGRSPELAQGAIRFSLGRVTTAVEVARAVEVFVTGVERLRRLAPPA
ncbi:MAG: aminotransferase class V-fold PLP-dependent enzyme [Gammaproteobacteria bacterium]|nr:aminotransferase class V-fold PLP-dependent enzyme [Gammaproteobacteria bacterium]